MEKEEIIENEVLKGHNKKSFGKSSILGFFIGLAVIVPGVSGSTISIIFKLYQQLLYCLSNIFKKFLKCLKYLIPIIIGAIVGVVFGFFAVKELINILPFATIMLFVGLMAGSFPGVKDEATEEKAKPVHWVLFAIGIIVPIAISIGSYFLSQKDGAVTAEKIISNFSIWKALLFVAIGYVVAITQVVPGLSATSFLMSFGYFTPLINSVSLTFWKSNPIIFAVYACLAVGFLLGLFSFSKFLTFMFKHLKAGTLYTILGLSLGSILAMLCSPDMISIYLSWAQTSTLEIVDIVCGIVMLISGILVGFALIKYERARKKDKISTNI